MIKEKIAISINSSILKLVDSKIDGSIMRSRSQAIEYYLKKGLDEESITTAVLLLKGTQQEALFSILNGKTLIANQIEFFKNPLPNIP